jgi:hypothetical protein
MAGGGVTAVVVGTQDGADSGGGTAADALPAVDGGAGDPGQVAAGPAGGAGSAGDHGTASEAGSSTAGEMTEEQALARLGAMRSASLQGLVLDERWVAQVASKSIGIVDPLQTAANGTHTFYAADILAESEAALTTVGTPYSVLLLQATDFGKRSVAPDGQPYWVTLVDAGFGSADDVDLWCSRTYPALSADELANACAPRTLSPPHD